MIENPEKQEEAYTRRDCLFSDRKFKLLNQKKTLKGQGQEEDLILLSVSFL